MENYLNSYKLTAEELEKKAKRYAENGETSEKLTERAKAAMDCVLQDIEMLQTRIWNTCGHSNLASLCDADYLNHDLEQIAGMVEDIETSCDEILVHSVLQALRTDIRLCAQYEQLAEALAK